MGKLMGFRLWKSFLPNLLYPLSSFSRAKNQLSTVHTLSIQNWVIDSEELCVCLILIIMCLLIKFFLYRTRAFLHACVRRQQKKDKHFNAKAKVESLQIDKHIV